MLHDRAVALQVRLGIVSILQDNTSAEAAAELVRAAELWISKAAGGPGGLSPEEGALLQATLLDWRGKPGFASIVPSEELVDVLLWNVRHRYGRIEKDGERLEIAAAAPMDDQTRSMLAFEAVIANYRTSMLWNSLMAALLEPDRARLRELLRQSPMDEAGFRYSVATALVAIGDAEATAELKRRLDAGEVPDPQTRRFVEGAIVHSEAQQSAESILKFIANSDPMGTYTPSWAIGTALRLGASRDALRGALDAHAAHVRDYTAALTMNRPQNAPRLVRTYLWPVKDAAIKAGVFDENDWPYVKAPESPGPMR